MNENPKHTPPKRADALLAWFCAPHLREDIQGDLHELFHLRVERDGLRRARLRYWIDVTCFFRPYVLRRQPLPYEHSRGPIMLKNYLKIAFRNLRRQPGYAFINIGGLAVGLAVCLLILLYVQDELTFDTHHPQADRIVRIVEAEPSSDQGEVHESYTMGPLGPTLVAEMPDVEQSVRVAGPWMSGRFTIERGTNRFYSGDHIFAEPAFVEVFHFDWLQGNPETALTRPLTVVLTESAVQQYFGGENPMGQTLITEAFGDIEVTGVLKDPPSNTHLDFSMIFSFATVENIEGWRNYMERWESGGFATYLVLAEGTDIGTVSAALPAFVAANREADEDMPRPYLQPLADIHFGSSHIEFDFNAHKGNRAYLYIFSAVALFILLIACINYMNMATARSMRRAKEVGLRKVVGAHRLQLIRQFLSESMLTAGIGLVLAMGLVVVLLAPFNTLAGKDLALDLMQNWPFLASLAVLALLVGLVSGSYPALFLSRFRPAQVLKGTEAAAGAARLRRGLVITQFTLSIAMMVATLVVYNQMQYVQQKNLGFNQDHLVVIDINNGDVRRDFETVKAGFAAVPSVQSVSVSSRVPGEWKDLTQIQAQPEGTSDTNQLTTMYFIGVDEDFLDTYAIDVVDGRGFASDFATDSLSVLLNETAARQLGLALGDRLRVPSASLMRPFQDTEFLPRVVGIVQDFHVRSLHEEIGPVVLGYNHNPIRVIDYFTARIDGRDVPGTIAQLQAVGEQFDTETPFEYNFLDERLADFYERETRLATLFAIAAILAIIIACLGLFGLASFTAEQRTKEIGVRKVLGATVPGIMLLLSKDFVKLVGIAFVIAAPLAYFAMNRWLTDFAYRTDLSWWIFALAGGAALAIALLTVSYQSIRAAMTDPVKSLRYE